LLVLVLTTPYLLACSSDGDKGGGSVVDTTGREVVVEAEQESLEAELVEDVAEVARPTWGRRVGGEGECLALPLCVIPTPWEPGQGRRGALG
jgi:hypothetical protein